MTGAERAAWIIRNLLNESQLAVIPPGETLALRFLANDETTDAGAEQDLGEPPED